MRSGGKNVANRNRSQISRYDAAREDGTKARWLRYLVVRGQPWRCHALVLGDRCAPQGAAAAPGVCWFVSLDDLASATRHLAFQHVALRFWALWT